MLQKDPCYQCNQTLSPNLPTFAWLQINQRQSKNANVKLNQKEREREREKILNVINIM